MVPHTDEAVGSHSVDWNNVIERLFWYDCMSKLKQCFGGELPYSRAQQDAVDREIGVSAEDSIILTRGRVHVGAARFIKVGESPWVLIGVYICEQFQRQGIMTALYPKLRQEYGEFFVAAPYSDAMLAFLEKVLAEDSAFKGARP